MHFLRGTTGTQQRLTELEGFVLMETRLEPSSHIPMHTHENATVVLILAGEYREDFRGDCSPLAPLTVVAKPSGEKHANDVGEKGAHCLVVELTDSKLRELAGIAPVCEAPRVQAGGPAARTGLRIVRELRESDPLTPLALESAALQLVVDLSRQAPRTFASEPKWMSALVERLHGTPARELRLSTLASVVGVHPVHLARTFRRIHGCSIGEFARRLRIETATRMLTQTRTPLSEVALAAGFYDQSHMARTFRRETGMSASRIRAVAQG